jgi:hypothetical protein
MDKERAKKIITYQKNDEHIQLQIAQNLKLCQTTMFPVINKAQQTSEKCHDRVDCMDLRVTRLDDNDTGKVTTLWKERGAVIKAFWGLVITVIASLMISIITQNWHQIRTEKCLDVLTTELEKTVNSKPNGASNGLRQP